MSIEPPRKSTKGVRFVTSGRQRKGKTELGGPGSTAMPCFFCKETSTTSSVSSSLLESIMKVKSYMCIPIQLRDQAAADIVLCTKCLDILSQIEGWVDLLRQRIFDAHEGAVLYPETPPWLQALAASASVPRKTATSKTVPPSIPLGSAEKRKAPPLPLSTSATTVTSSAVPVPPKKLAAATATAAATAATGNTTNEDGVSFLTLPISSTELPFLTVPVSSSNASGAAAAAANAALSKSAMRSAIDSLTSLVNVVRSSPKNQTSVNAGASDAQQLVVKESPEAVSVKDEPSNEKVVNNGSNNHNQTTTTTTPTPTQPFDIALRWCSVCSASYHNESVFKRHIVSIHPELCFKCELCGQLFASESSRDIHVAHGCCDRPTNRTRVLRCTDCHATFLGKYELKRHVLLTSHMGGVSGQA